MFTKFKDIDINELADIQNVEIDGNLPKDERIKSYIEQIGNPYLYRCDDVIVRVSYSNSSESFEDRLKAYFLSQVNA